MDFIENLLHISPDGGNGSSEYLIVFLVVVAFVTFVSTLRRYLPKSFVDFLEQLGKRENSDRFDN
jgi:hypothetical protein